MSADSIFEEPSPTHVNVQVRLVAHPDRVEAFALPQKWAVGWGSTVGEALTRLSTEIRNEIPQAWSLALHISEVSHG